MVYLPKSNCYLKEGYWGEYVLGLRIGEPYSHIYGSPAKIYISPLVSEEDKGYVFLHEILHHPDEYINRVLTESLAKDILGISTSPLPKYI